MRRNPAISGPRKARRFLNSCFGPSPSISFHPSSTPALLVHLHCIQGGARADGLPIAGLILSFQNTMRLSRRFTTASSLSPSSLRIRWRGLVLPAFAAVAFTVAHGAARADATQTPSVYVQADKAGSKSDTQGLTLGATTPIRYQSSLWGAQVGAYWEFYASRFSASARDGDGHELTTLMGVTPVFRLRFDNGLSPWFADAGIGVSYTNRLYRSDVKQFSTRFNFGTNLAVGYSFGAQRDQEISLRFEHYSNAGYKEPNPGENFLEVRYAHLF